MIGSISPLSYSLAKKFTHISTQNTGVYIIFIIYLTGISCRVSRSTNTSRYIILVRTTWTWRSVSTEQWTRSSLSGEVMKWVVLQRAPPWTTWPLLKSSYYIPIFKIPILSLSKLDPVSSEFLEVRSVTILLILHITLPGDSTWSRGPYHRWSRDLSPVRVTWPYTSNTPVFPGSSLATSFQSAPAGRVRERSNLSQHSYNRTNQDYTLR